MSTKFLSPGWRMPRNANQSKSSNYSLKGTNPNVRINISSPAEVGITSSFSFWLKRTNNTVVSQPYRVVGSGLYGFYMAGTSAIYVRYGAGAETFDSTATQNALALTDWVHWVITRQEVTSTTQDVKLYANGNLVDSVTGTTLLNVPPSYTIPLDSKVDSLMYQIQATDSMNSFAIFDYVLKPGQVTTLYGNSTNGVGNPMALPSSPIAYYPLGTSAYNGEYLAENNAIGDYVFDFDSSNINCGNDSALNLTTEISLSAWVKTTDQDSTNNIVKKDDGAGNRSWNLSWRGSSGGGSRLVFWNWSSDGSYNYIYTTGTPASNFADGNWHHVVATYDGTTDTNGAKIYLDGDLMSQGAVFRPGTGLDITTANVTIGNDLTASISNVQIFNTPLSGPEVETLYNYGSPIRTLASIPQNSNLKAWYKLDASEVYNSSTTEWEVNEATSPWTSSLSFDTSRIQVSNQSLGITSEIAISAWVKIPAGSTGGASPNVKQIVSEDTTSTGSRNWILSWRGGTYKDFYFAVFHSDGTSTSIYSNVGDINDGKWHYVVGTWDGTTNANAFKIYVDNVATSTTSTKTDIIATSNIPTTIGAIPTTFNRAFDGNISNVQIWDTNLSSTEVETLYNNGSPTQTLANIPQNSNLQGWWKLDNTTTGIEDSSGNGNNGTNNGATEVYGSVSTLNGESSGMSQANLVQSDLQTVAPYSKYAMDFDGTDYIQIPYNVNLTPQNGNFTISAWINTDNLSGWHPIWSTQNLTSSTVPLVALHTYGNKVRATVGGSTNSPSYPASWALLLDSTQSLTTSTWYHIAVTFNISGNAQIYINGSPDNSGPIENPQTSWSTGDRFIGDGEGFWDGRISNLSIWNTDLTSAQVTEIYNEGLPSNLNSHSAYSNLVSWWQLGENSSYVGGAANPWTFADEKETNNGTSGNLPEIALTNGVGTTANGVSASMGVGSLVGDAPYSTANALSSGMSVVSRVSGVSDATITTGGTGYSAGTNIATTGGSGTNCTINITTISGGAITAITINSGGNNYLIGDVLTVSGGNGNATITVSGLNTP